MQGHLYCENLKVDLIKRMSEINLENRRKFKGREGRSMNGMRGGGWL